MDPSSVSDVFALGLPAMMQAFSIMAGIGLGIGIIRFIAKNIQYSIRDSNRAWERDELIARMVSRSDEITERDVAKAYETIQTYEKQKNDHKVKNEDKPKNDWRLGDDGEMIEVSPSQFFSSNER